jgi:hypothetical protein
MAAPAASVSSPSDLQIFMSGKGIQAMLTAAFHIIRDRVVYRDLGADHFTKRDPAKAAKRLLKRLEGLGYAVEARPTTAVVSI